MAAGILAEIGTEYGPCKEECKHRDCDLTRRMAAAHCAICGKPIGYGVRFYQLQEKDERNSRCGTIVEGNQYTHAVCLEQQASLKV